MDTNTILKTAIISLSLFVLYSCDQSEKLSGSRNYSISDRISKSVLNRYIVDYIDSNNYRALMISVYITSYDSATLSIHLTASTPGKDLLLITKPDDFYFIDSTLILVSAGLAQLVETDSLFYEKMIAQINERYKIPDDFQGFFHPNDWIIKVHRGAYSVQKFNYTITPPSLRRLPPL